MTGSLQNYSTYSVLSGTMEPKVWIAEAKRLGYDYLGLTDKSTLAGLVEFQKECKEQEIKPLLGAEFLMVDDASLRDKTQELGAVILYAKNEAGYKNLITINNRSQNRDTDAGGGFFYRARIDAKFLAEHSEGLVCIVPTIDGYGMRGLKDGVANEAVESIVKLDDLHYIFGLDFYVGVDISIDEDDAWYPVMERLMKLPYKKVVATNNHTPTEDTIHLLKVVRKLDHQNRQRKNLDRHIAYGCLVDADTIEETVGHYGFTDLSAEVAEKCNFVVQLGETFMPTPDCIFANSTEDIMFLSGQGFKKKLCPEMDIEKLENLDELLPYAEFFPHEHLAKGEAQDTLQNLGVYVERLRYEFEIIEQLGFMDYFNLVLKFCTVSDDMGHSRNYGRGSAGGSLVAYLLGITLIDPVRHDLLFERFLNPDRNDLPDIDLDFSKAGRDEVKNWMRDNYGGRRVVNIGTYGRLKVISGIQKLAKAYAFALPDNTGELVEYSAQSLQGQISNLHVAATKRGAAELEGLLEYDSFSKLYARHSDWIDSVVMPLCETIWNTGIHASGMLILPSDYNECMPVMSHSTSDFMITQYRDRICEEAGYPKFDILGLRNLDVLDHVKASLKKRGIDTPAFDEIPLDDPQAIAIFHEANTEGIFQFGTYSFQSYLPKLKPDTFDHIVAAVALIRPGTMKADVHKLFADAKNGYADVSYAHEDLAGITSQTYGFMVYQEQMMAIVKKIGGLTGAEADYVRKACGKKKLEDMEKWEAVFKEGAEGLNYEETMVEELWHNIVYFAEYSFNKAHSVCYASLAYYQAYLKARYPMEFWCASLSFADTGKGRGNKNSVYALKERAEKHGIEFVYPEMGAFATTFAPAGKNKIMWPLSAISGFGTSTLNVVDEIGIYSFKDMNQMLEMWPTKYVKKTAYINLIRAGFFNEAGKPREMMQMLLDLRRQLKISKKDEEVPFKYDHDDDFKWALERRDAFGTLTQPWKDSPLFHENVQSYPGQSLQQVEDDTPVFIGGFVESIYTKQNKYGNWFARVTLVDTDERHTVYIWNKVWEQECLDIPDENGKRQRIRKGQLVELAGMKRSWNERPQVSVGEIDNYIRIVADAGE